MVYVHRLTRLDFLSEMDEPDLKHGVKWDDEEAVRPSRGLRRAQSSGSMSIRSVRSRREVDPSIILPIQYRTV